MYYHKVSDFYSFIDSNSLPSETLLFLIEPYLIDIPSSGKGGPKPKPVWLFFCAIHYRLRTGCQWKAIPKILAAPSTAHYFYQYWVSKAVFQ